MPTLYVENIPKELYDALRNEARQHRKSISAEVMSILEEHIVTPAELKSRKRFFQETRQLRARAHAAAGASPSSEDMLHADRSR
jgi:antitoxin FitA